MRDFVEMHRKGFQIFVWGFVIFIGCFGFPLYSEEFPLMILKVWLIISCLFTMGETFAILYYDKERMAVNVCIQTFLFSIVGLICRYFLEFGEMSNTYNFTVKNIVLYLVCIPILTSICYRIMRKRLLQDS